MSPTLHLMVRTPHGLAYDGAVRRVRAEDQDGWVGILPGRRDLVGVLVPSLVLFEDEQGEGFIAIPGGLLDLRAGRCRVMSREAQVARDPALAARELTRILGGRHERAAHQRQIMSDLEREALRRLAQALDDR